MPVKQSTGYPNITPLLAQLLYNRGLAEPTQFEPFLAADEQFLNDPLLLPGMDKAVSRILRALLRREHIAVFGDFDTDGITATALLMQGLSLLGGMVIPYIPHRIEEGHGLNHNALRKLSQQGIGLVMTVDCGITACAEVAQATEEGLDIIITDHHRPPPTLPTAYAVIDPKQDGSAYPFPELSGVGVAFKLLQALFQVVGKERELERFLDLVALGTVADLVPLLGENRYLVKQGLEVLNRSPRLGLRKLMSRAGLEMGRLDAESISYTLAPRLNAPGRLAHASTSYELLTTESEERGEQLAAQLEGVNAERQRLTLEVLHKAKDKLTTDAPLLIVGGEDFPPGVLGVVASRLVDEFYRPAAVLALGSEISRGSARSIPEFDIIAALTECHHLLSRFGGHAQAAGFTLPSANVAPLGERLIELARQRLADVELCPVLTIDTEIPLSTLGGDTLKLIERLAPFGAGNPVPTFLTRGVKVVDYRYLGSEGEHLKLKLQDGKVIWDAIGFGLGNRAPSIASYLDIVYNLRVDRWEGTERLQLNIRDFLP